MMEMASLCAGDISDSYIERGDVRYIGGRVSYASLEMLAILITDRKLNYF
jgi:hypothetical protein